MSQVTDDQSLSQRKGIKKSYVSPSLIEYGNVAKLTQSGTGSGTDGGTVAGMMKQCL